MSPRLGALTHSFEGVQERVGSLPPPASSSKETRPPVSERTRLATAWSGDHPGPDGGPARPWGGRRGGRRSSAFSHWRPIRSGNVFKPLWASQASKGPRVPPTSFLMLSSAPSYGGLRATTPAVRSPWPERYLVALWTTRSAPSSSGAAERVCRRCCPPRAQRRPRARPRQRPRCRPRAGGGWRWSR